MLRHYYADAAISPPPDTLPPAFHGYAAFADISRHYAGRRRHLRHYFAIDYCRYAMLMMLSLLRIIFAERFHFRLIISL